MQTLHHKLYFNLVEKFIRASFTIRMTIFSSSQAKWTNVSNRNEIFLEFLKYTKEMITKKKEKSFE